MDDMQFKGGPAIVNCIVLSTQNANGKVVVRLHNFANNDIGSGIPVQVVGSAYPKIGDTGLVIFADSMNQFEDGYWLGGTANRFYNGDITRKDHGRSLPEGTKYLISDNSLQQILVGNNETKITSGTSHVTLTQDNFQITSPDKSLVFDKDGFKLTWLKGTAVTSKMTISPKIVEISSDGTFLLQSTNDFNIKADGNIVIAGQSVEQKPATSFHVKANKITLDAGSGALTGSASAFNIKVSSSSAGTTNGAPGAGTQTAASIEVVQGNMDYSVGVGDITVRALSPLNKIRLFNGTLAVGSQSFIEMNGFETIVGAESLPGVGATIKMSRLGLIDMNALLDVNINATKAFNMTATLNAEIKALANMVLQAIKLDIKGSLMVAVETAILDLKNAKIIDAGPKVVTPGVGPFCSIPVCPMIGVPHTGSQCLG